MKLIINKKKKKKKNYKVLEVNLGDALTSLCMYILRRYVALSGNQSIQGPRPRAAVVVRVGGNVKSVGYF